jgi:hypothetical protein
VHAVRHEKTAPVTPCQVVPIALASDVVAEIRRVPPARLVVRIAQDQESADNLPPSPSLAGKSYDVEAASAGLVVRDSNGPGARGEYHEPTASLATRPVDDEEARRVRALASAAMPLLASTDGAALGRAVEAVVDTHLRGMPATGVVASVQPASPWAFTVRLDANVSDAGMCHRWSTTAHLDGDLFLRADGTLRSLRLQGPVTTTEALCTEGAREAGVSDAPRTCTRGDVAIAVDAACAPGP